MTDHTYAFNSLKSFGLADAITGNNNHVNLLKYA